MIIIGLILIILSGMAEAIMDTLQFHYDTSIFKKFKNQRFWYPGFSWMNKWKDGDPKNGERFLGSSTIFVGFTDAWHLFKFIHNQTLFLGLLFIAGISFHYILWFALARILFGLAFSIVYKYIG
jgi:hypothetical protein